MTLEKKLETSAHHGRVPSARPFLFLSSFRFVFCLRRRRRRFGRFFFSFGFRLFRRRKAGRTESAPSTKTRLIAYQFSDVAGQKRKKESDPDMC